MIKIFDIEKSEDEINETLYAIEFWNRKKIELEKWHKDNLKIKEIINDYHKGYEDLLEKIISEKDNYPFLKNAVNKIFEDYFKLFLVDFNRFFQDMKEKCPLILFTMMAKDNFRNYKINNEKLLFDDFIKKEIFK